MARRKAPGGMPRVLFTRCDEVLVDRVERARQQIIRDTGVEVSTSDAVRVLLGEALAERGILTPVE